MNTSVDATLLRTPRSAWLMVLLSVFVTNGCQSPNVFTAKNDSSSTNSVEPVSATSQQAGLPKPTNAGATNATPSLTTVGEHLRLGEAELEQGNFAQAQVHFDHVLQQHPGHVRANHRLGVLADNLGRYPQAEQYYRKALEGDPRNAALLSDLGYSYWMQGRYAESEQYLLEARRFDPNYRKAIANLGLLYLSTGRREQGAATLAHIGDEAEVQKIMKQFADGQLQPPQQPLNQFTPSQQTTVVTTQSTAQHAAPATSQDMNAATREFVEQMRLAREELRRAEEQLARQRAQTVSPPAQHAPSATISGGQPSPAWAQHAAASQVSAQPATQYTGVDPFAGQQRVTAAPARPVPDAHLAEQMAAIDRRDQPSLTRGPVVIGTPDTHENGVHSQTPTQAELPVINGGPPYGERVSRSTSPDGRIPAQQQIQVSASSPTAPQHWPAPGTQQPLQQTDQPQAPGTTFAHGAGHGSQSPQSSTWNPQVETSVGQSAPVQTGMSVPSGGVNQSQMIQQLSAGNSRSAQRPVEHAYHTQQPGRRPDISLAGQSGVSNRHDSPSSYSQQQQLSQPPPSANPQQPHVSNSYEQARREAALMGLGAGPGQVFPYIQQTPRAMPGTDSRLNGAQYPAPARHMPTGLVPPNLNQQALSPAPTNRPAAANHRGQSMPSVPTQTTVPASSPTQGANYQTYHYGNHGQQPVPVPTTPYQDVRSQQSAELNGLVNQTWGQSPQSPPYGVTPPSAINQQPPGMGTMPSAPSTVIQASQSLPAAQKPEPQPWNTAVVPGVHRSPAPATVPVPQPNNQQAPVPNPRQAPIPQRQPQPYQGPVIVPSHR